MATKFVLIGSGLAGGLLAAYLGRRGYDVDLYERRGDPREGSMLEGRSINLALSTRGIHALERIGIADEVLKHAIPMRGRMIHEKSGGLHFAPYDVDPNKHINSIGRAALNTAVIEQKIREIAGRVAASEGLELVDVELRGGKMAEVFKDDERFLVDDDVRLNGFQENIAQGKPNNWRCRAGSRFLYICEHGLVHYCSQQRAFPASHFPRIQKRTSGGSSLQKSHALQYAPSPAFIRLR